MKLTKRQLVDRTVDWLLNVYDEVEDPIGALSERLNNDPAKAGEIFANVQNVAKENPVRFRQLFRPEMGDVTARKFVSEQFSA